MERQASRILSTDFLSPALWAALYPDFLQRFIPTPIPELDRAVYLERAFEQAWPKTASGRNPMTDSFFDLCGPAMSKCLGGATPLLAFNVTNVETGLQIVLSPVNLTDLHLDPGKPNPSHKIFDFLELGALDHLFDLPLSTAVGLSARFPYISPPGWYAWLDEGTKTVSRVTFVDGGYVDNSGVATALNIAQRLDALDPRPNIDIKLIMLSALWSPAEQIFLGADKSSRADKGEITPPLEAAYNARQGRAYKTQFDAALQSKPSLSVSELGFYYNYVRPPLGWQLSDVSRGYIRLFRGRPERCPLGSEREYNDYISRSFQNEEEATASFIRRADCVVARIRNELTPTDPPIPASWRPISPAH